MSKITLIIVGDDTNIDSSKISISNFKKFNEGDVIAVNAMHSLEFQKMSQDLGAIVYTPEYKLPYPAFPSSEYNRLVDVFYSAVLRPAMMSKTEYTMFSEPDCLFFNPINQNIFEGDYDIIVPSDVTNQKLMWVFAPYWDGFGLNDHEKSVNFNSFMEELDTFCNTVGINFRAAAEKDLRFIFMANSIIKTDKLRHIFLHEESRMKKIIMKLAELSFKYRGTEPNFFHRYIHTLSVDHIISIIFGLFEFRWRLNENGYNRHPNLIKTEEDLKNMLEQNPNVEYIHSCKLYYSKKMI